MLILKSSKRLVFGIGINDADYKTNRTELINGKRMGVWRCPFYRKWSDMLRRCQEGNDFQAARKTYSGCSVCKEWTVFSIFKSWMESQNWDGMCLDKDIITPGNKVYSPETCAFISAKVNTFITDAGAVRGDHPIGVVFHKKHQRYLAQCGNPFTGKREHIGIFSCSEQASAAWKKRKNELANILADEIEDSRAAKSLRVRYQEAHTNDQ